jgi:hypothetical protein
VQFSSGALHLQRFDCRQAAAVVAIAIALQLAAVTEYAFKVAQSLHRCASTTLQEYVAANSSWNIIAVCQATSVLCTLAEFNTGQLN